MIEYNYNKKEKKFTENGHTMFEFDVLQRLKRLADIEEQIKQRKLLSIKCVIDSLPTKLDIATEFKLDNNWSIEDRTHAIGKRCGARWMRDKVVSL